jgi:hypothetical protein
VELPRQTSTWSSISSPRGTSPFILQPRGIGQTHIQNSRASQSDKKAALPHKIVCLSLVLSFRSGRFAIST